MRGDAGSCSFQCALWPHVDPAVGRIEVVDKVLREGDGIVELALPLGGGAVPEPEVEYGDVDGVGEVERLSHNLSPCSGLGMETPTEFHGLETGVTGRGQGSDDAKNVGLKEERHGLLGIAWMSQDIRLGVSHLLLKGPHLGVALRCLTSIRLQGGFVRAEAS